ncbi:hypothetical protein BASA50_001496 [Batrachochytrium salamandrivorans]|uniref:Uncharacterized protein n=1 Tax=Batrachochytrium salamandrivorans TaxID=1357716 RepID=A0ABQ8FPL7_9FUNG|nr:hypothetical protein BASA62_002086 [Batrachochytrium salamandrivorans]KAH6596729.1 hypothetical protein BASA61_003423 [Batrachochytrium salamandrivorans]KAH6601639.1 hypothetical protein BASA50_001496 [Batrachochytrium salamandrivorans]KAH9269673.1 hypothetical protein BASA83_008334 [Batrachochytrium salamandrivorans]
MIELVLFSGLESGSIHDPSLGDIWIEFKQSVWTHQSKYTFVDRLSGATVGPALKMQFLIQNKGIGCDMPCGHLDIPPNYHTVSESGVGHWPMSLPRTINAKSQASMDARHEIRFDPCGRHHLHSHIDCTTMDPTYSQILPAPTNEAIPPTHPLPINHRPCKRYRPRLRVIRRKKVLLTSYEKQVLVDSINSALGLKQGATTYDISGYPQLPRSITFRSFP